MNSDPWEAIRHLTIDQLVTQVKLAGSSFLLCGNTTPENWPFRMILVIGKPGNEGALLLIEKIREEFARRAPTHEATNPRNRSNE